jgi:hypothetical protein
MFPTLPMIQLKHPYGEKNKSSVNNWQSLSSKVI